MRHRHWIWDLGIPIRPRDQSTIARSADSPCKIQEIAGRWRADGSFSLWEGWAFCYCVPSGQAYNWCWLLHAPLSASRLQGLTPASSGERYSCTNAAPCPRTNSHSDNRFHCYQTGRSWSLFSKPLPLRLAPVPTTHQKTAAVNVWSAEIAVREFTRDMDTMHETTVAMVCVQVHLADGKLCGGLGDLKVRMTGWPVRLFSYLRTFGLPFVKKFPFKIFCFVV